MNFLTDMWFHLKRTICIVRRKHLQERFAGNFVKKGFRPIEVLQCEFCAELRIPKMKRLGGKEIM